MTIPEQAVQAASHAVILGEDENGNPVHLSNEEARAALTAAAPHLASVRVKKIGYVSAVELYTLQQIETCVDLFTVAQSGPMKFVPVYAAADQVFGNSEQLNSSIDNGLPASEKTVKRRVADALENVWTALDCDVDQIERVIAHMRENGLRIVETVKIDNTEVILEPSAGRAAVLEEAAKIAEDYVQYDVADAIRLLASHPVADHTQCERCQGNGEIVTDWERYKHPHENDVGDEAIAECPDCNGYGCAEAIAHPVADKPDAFPQPRRKDGEEPCGECHLQSGETCDICGAVADKPDEAGAQGEGWLPIESAPIGNGSNRFLAYITGHGPCVCYRNANGTVLSVDGRTILRATHWRPLPSAPSEGAE